MRREKLLNIIFYGHSFQQQFIVCKVSHRSFVYSGLCLRSFFFKYFAPSHYCCFSSVFLVFCFQKLVCVQTTLNAALKATNVFSKDIFAVIVNVRFYDTLSSFLLALFSFHSFLSILNMTVTAAAASINIQIVCVMANVWHGY